MSYWTATSKIFQRQAPPDNHTYLNTHEMSKHVLQIVSKCRSKCLKHTTDRLLHISLRYKVDYKRLYGKWSLEYGQLIVKSVMNLYEHIPKYKLKFRLGINSVCKVIMYKIPILISLNYFVRFTNDGTLFIFICSRMVFQLNEGYESKPLFGGISLTLFTVI